MKISNQLKLGTICAIAAFGLISCGDDDPIIPVVPVADPQGDCPSVGNLTITESATGQCLVSAGVLTESATLEAGMTWYLDGRLQVGNNASAATLTMESGTQIRGSGTDHILVWPGSNIVANGTADAPVQMLSDDANTTGSGEWGGLFIRGFTGLPTLTGTQGANDLNFVVVAEAGAAVTVDIDGTSPTYQDNIVLNGVDATTTMRFIQSHYSARDGFHILNGDPRMAWILSTASGRDGVWYRDFTGLIKDLMVIHNPDSDGSTGRAGIYASETTAGNSNPRIINATLVGRDSTSVAAGTIADANEFGILFADNTDTFRYGNIAIVNFRHGCYEADEGADLSGITVGLPGPDYFDGIHCLHEAGANPTFGITRTNATGFPAGVVAPFNSNGEGFNYYNGVANPATFLGETSDLSESFTASWYLQSIGSFNNNSLLELPITPSFLNTFLNGDTNNDGTVNAMDEGSPFIIMDNAFNSDVGMSGGYNSTTVGAVRGGMPASNAQFDGWTVDTGASEGFVVMQPPASTDAAQ